MNNTSEYNKLYYLNNIESKKEYDKSPETKERRRKRLIKSKYGLSYKEWEGLWYAQDGRCAICDKFIAEPKNICIDHNHKTGEVRGLLCKECNLALGCFFDNPELTNLATEYLKS